MDPRIGPIMAAALFAPFALALIAAVALDLSQSNRDRTDGVAASWAELRITQGFLIVGHHRTARRIPLGGLKVTVTETGSPGDDPGSHRVLLTIDGLDDEPIQRSQPYSSGAATAARMFAILANRASWQQSTADTAGPTLVDLPRAA
ncbi:hypothetical protein BayCH28_22090 [Mycolicibacterium sp. CH28]|uniref:hypothetical protein n=1 Tax=Mycolicibacterium sp. CH28 TaxID=2512237 RepID=UPI00107FF08D|nr:hypothetical protein [Mycolicibacterium sp. CH28]TGD85703.1 hypothetical protein BayCH28_22090 [Mycolicibacterium sp. CH28]